MTAEAVVLATRADGRVDLEFSSAKACAGCAGTCLWKRLQAARLDRLPVSTALEPGARVTVSLPGQRVLLASILMYGAPLAAILAGAAIGSWGTGTDLGTLAGAGIALAIVVLSFGFWRQRLEMSTLKNLVVTPRS